MNNCNDSMLRYAENVAKMSQTVQEIYGSDSYLRMAQSARSISESLQGITPNYMKSLQHIQKITEILQLSVPKVYYNHTAIEAMNKMVENISRSSLAYTGNKDLYKALQRNFELQMKVYKQENFIKPGDKIRQSMTDIEVLSSNLQRAVETLQIAESSDLDMVDEETINAYATDIDKVMNGELSDAEIVEKNEKSEGIFAKVIRWLVIFVFTTFFGGYIQHVCGPIYESLDKVFLKEDIDDASKNTRML